MIQVILVVLKNGLSLKELFIIAKSASSEENAWYTLIVDLV
ncbi:hypothetical protein ACIN5065_2602 [Acinetobacter baumannii OIFC065]|nr:hypothetical protein ACINIS116_1161 [Acinetobacter baumannii IS-116]EKP36829.1 hypothetical protein ACIN5065_2602 [Acinetobacter baumannii OIFC065]